MVTKIGSHVQQFYNKTPFPDYDLSRFNTKEDLRLSAYNFAQILDRSIPQDASIIDIGTGTGQLSAFLSLRRACVWGIDFSDGSLNKARALKDKLGLTTWHLQRVDILDEKQIESIGKQFDYVLCMGVLHHTGDAHRGFKNILKLLKPQGYLAVGLYNKIGRIPLKLRILAAKTIFKNNNRVKDYFIRMQIGEVEDKERARGWWNDQYCHPHETTHTVGEVLRLFKWGNLEYHHTTPSLNPFNQSSLDVAGVWNRTQEIKPIFPVRAYQQVTWLHKTQREGGYWITFGRRKA